MVAVFIDESGNFTPSRPFHVVSALSLPHASLKNARRLLARISHSWPHVEGELKGGALNSEHLKALVDCLYRQQAILHSTICYIDPDHAAMIAEHQAQQASLMTKHLTDDHLPQLKAQVWALRGRLEAMPPQLYIQCVAQKELLCAVAEEVPNYLSQREPKEFGRFEWFVDAKDKRITPQEGWWRDTLGPLIESRSLRSPFALFDIPTADYSHFDAAYGMAKTVWRPNLPREVKDGTNIKKLVTDSLHFIDSKADILIQAVDILCRFMRRAVDGEPLSSTAIDSLGRLQIKKRKQGVLQSVQLISFSDGVPETDERLVDVIQQMSRAARPYFTKQSMSLLQEDQLQHNT